MAGTLAEAVRDLDAARFVRDHEGLGRLRAALEATTTPQEAHTICETIVRFVATRAGERCTAQASI